jgi:hypothetical protein
MQTTKSPFHQTTSGLAFQKALGAHIISRTKLLGNNSFKQLKNYIKIFLREKIEKHEAYMIIY